MLNIKTNKALVDHVPPINPNFPLEHLSVHIAQQGRSKALAQ